eukprot:TRINITY_DN11788_c0_g1_i1.p1 TRINITY_DN11788_c0_g1~~TRINITY_DN11788_c0_g1_i1.p1  ORF type:complete len:221 (+),score=56.12 TRINITY_DN11788_c0_g1_i1:1-663(+)
MSFSTPHHSQPSLDLRLWKDKAERDEVESLSELYSIILATEHLERAYFRDAISAKEYTQACSKLISHFKTLQKQLSVNVSKFVKDYQLDCKSAITRLVVVGIPASVEHGDVTRSGENPKNTQKIVAETVQFYITALDELKLERYAIDQLQPHIIEIVDGLDRLAVQMPAISTLDPRSSLKRWLEEFSKMRASDELNEEQARQLSFDLDSSYAAFHKVLLM